MNHSFNRSWLDKEKCGICKRAEFMHGDEANCEACGITCKVEIYPQMSAINNLALCASCIEKEQKVIDDNYAAISALNEAAKSKLPDSVDITQSINQKINNDKSLIECRQEFYNAECAAIVAVKAEIDNDTSITTPEAKRFKLAQIVQQNIIQYQKALFEISEKQTEMTNKMRANIVYFNGVIDLLRTQEREQLKIKDANYVPVGNKPLNSVAAPPKLSKIDKTIDSFAKYRKISFDEAKRRLGF